MEHDVKTLGVDVDQGDLAARHVGHLHEVLGKRMRETAARSHMHDLDLTIAFAGKADGTDN